MIKLKVLLLSMLCSTFVIAGQGTGNGGDAVVCTKDDGSKSFELLDLYEMREMHGLDLITDTSLATAEEKSIHQLNKIYDWSLYENMSIRVKSFMSRIKFVNRELIDIPDSYHTYLPANCSIQQLAINHLNGIIEINKSLWDKLDVDNKGALILHELLYEDMLLTGFENSIGARFINAHLHASSSKVLGDSDDWRWQSKIETLIWNFFGDVDYMSGEQIAKLFKSTPYVELKPRLFKNLLKEENLPIFTNNFVLNLVDILKNEKISFEREIITSFSGFLSKKNEKWLFTLDPIKKYLLSKIEYVITNEDPKEYENYLYYYIESDTIDMLMDNFLKKFSFDKAEQKQFFESYEFLLGQPREGWGYSRGVKERLFYEVITSFNSLSSHELQIIAKDIKLYPNSRRPYLLSFLKRISEDTKLSESLLSEIYDRYVPMLEIEYTGSWNALVLLWKNNYKRNQISDLIGQYFKSNVAQDLLFFIISVDSDGSLYKRYEAQIVSLLQLRAPTFLDHYFVLLYKNRVVPQTLVNYYVNRYKGNLNNYSSKFDLLSILIRQENVNDNFIDMLGYQLRYSNYYDHYLVRLLINLSRSSKYLNSILIQEFKINSRNSSKVLSLLKIVEGKSLTEEIINVLKFIYNTTADDEIKELSKKILGL